MKKQSRKKAPLGLLLPAILLVFALIPFSASAQNSGNLTVWSFSDEVEHMVNKYYKPAHRGVTVNFTQFRPEQFESRLDPVLSSGRGVPDVVGLEVSFVRKYIESGKLLDITDIYEANKQKLAAYPVEIATYNGRVYGMSWQQCPGAMFYRRSLAKKYLGTDDPKVVQTYFANVNKFLETAKLLKDKSNGICVVVPGSDDLYKPFLSGRRSPWVVDGKIVIDPAMEQHMDICKALRDNGYEGRINQWSDQWFAGMKGEHRDEYGRALEVFSYFLPTWGLHYVLKTDAPRTSGDWAMIQGPLAYHWGGSWLAVWKDTPNPEAAKELIRYLTTDDKFLETYAKDTGDVVSNTNVIDKIKKNYKEPFLGGQNHYSEFADMAKNVNGKNVQGSDQAIENFWLETVKAFVNGEKSKAQALADFRTQVEAHLGL